MSINNSKPKEEKTENTQPEKRKKYFIEHLDLKEDNNMTRIYSVMINSNLFNPINNK